MILVRKNIMFHFSEEQLCDKRNPDLSPASLLCFCGGMEGGKIDVYQELVPQNLQMAIIRHRLQGDL